MANQLRVQDVGPAPALDGVFVGQRSIRQVVSLADVLGETAIHQRGRFTSQFFAPYTVLGLRLENLLQAETRKVFAPM